MQIAFSPTNHDITTIQTYRSTLESVYQTEPEKLWVIDERIKNLSKKRNTLSEKEKRYAEQIRFILCDVNPKTCPLVIEQPL